ncbi:MAG TPA: uroporphyrinogen-III synthase [Ruania sp.]|nr:uroporphyrinogen-III synthase [Ruania sp.]
MRAASDSAMLAGPPGPEVLVPRGGAWGTRVCDRLDAWGARGWVLPLIRTELVRTEQLERARHDLQYGRYDWVALTSAAAVTALPPQVGARIAVVGPATARAVTEAGHTVAYQPAEFSARGMLDSWHPTGKVLLLHSDLAAPTLADGLREQGTAVTDVIAYRTLPADVPAEQAARLRSGAADAALITSGSVARALADLHPPAALAAACLGPRTAEEAREAGLYVALVARQQHIDTLVADLQHWWTATAREGSTNR